MEPVTTSSLPVVSGGLLNGGRVTLTNVDVVDGKTFFHVSKSDREIERLLLGRVVPRERVLQHVMLFDVMIRKRDEALMEMSAPKAQDDLNFDEPAKKKNKKSKNLQNPTFVPLKIMAMDNQIVEMNVLADTGKKLFIELTTLNIAVLQGTVSHQINHRVARDEFRKGISFNKDRDSFVAKYEDNGKFHHKFFRVADEDKAAAKLLAIEFLESRT